MQRLQIKPRNDWQAQVESIGFQCHNPGATICWNEGTCYVFSAEEIAEFENATNEVHKMCLTAIDNVVQYKRYKELNIPEYAWGLIEKSWHRKESSIFGRIDFSYDGNQPPKLLEYNADTPFTITETSIVQREWLKQVRPDKAEFNRIHSALISAWRSLGAVIHLLCFDHPSEKEADTHINYFAETILESGHIAKVVTLNDLFWDGTYFRDPDGTIIKILVKLYSWKHFVDDFYKNYIHQTTMQVIEPIWKTILSNKALLVLLWELFPNHPNLLPAYFDPKHLKEGYAKKPLLGRGGQNITLRDKNTNISTEGNYATGPFVYQKLHPLPNMSGNYPLIGSWVIEGHSAGIGIREDITPITNENSFSVPHYIE